MIELRPLRSTSVRLHALVVALLTASLVSIVDLPSAAAPAPVVRLASPAVPVQHEGESLKEQYDGVLGEEAEVIARVEHARSEQARLSAELGQLQKDLDDTNVALLFAQAQYDDTQLLATIYAQAVVDAREKVEVATERLRKQIVATYVNGGADASVLEAMLQARNGEEVGQALTYSKAVTGDTRTLIEDLEAARAAAREADRLAKQNRDEAQRQRDEIEAARDFIAAARDNQVRLVDQINLHLMAEQAALMEVRGRKALVESRINAMTQSSDGVAMVLADLQRNQEAWNPGLVYLTNPLPGRRIGSKFGMRHHPILDISRLHAGGDMGAPSGTPIHAAADGLVVIASERGGYGLTVVIDHGSSIATLYAHQSTMAVSVGDVVQRGDVIGYVGSTGLSTGPHLHFETRIKGMPVDPEGVVDFEAELEDSDD